jgi:hypothetical protein
MSATGQEEPLAKRKNLAVVRLGLLLITASRVADTLGGLGLKH